MSNESRDGDVAVMVGSSQRPDGTWRKPIRIKPGYIAPELMPKYKAPHIVSQSTPNRLMISTTFCRDDAKKRLAKPLRPLYQHLHRKILSMPPLVRRKMQHLQSSWPSLERSSNRQHQKIFKATITLKKNRKL